MDSNKVIDKVRKLLALAQSDNEAEAKNAMLKAQKLMAKNSISFEEVSGKQQEEVFRATAKHKWNAKFRIPLSQIIAKNFRCEVFMEGNSIVFVGHENDVLICRKTFEFAYTFVYSMGNRAYNTAKKEGRKTQGVFNSYALGFIYGLKNALEAQAKALMIVTPPDVTEKLEEILGGAEPKTIKGINCTDYRAYRAGVEDGKNFTGRRQIEEGN